MACNKRRGKGETCLSFFSFLGGGITVFWNMLSLLELTRFRVCGNQNIIRSALEIVDPVPVKGECTDHRNTTNHPPVLPKVWIWGGHLEENIRQCK